MSALQLILINFNILVLFMIYRTVLEKGTMNRNFNRIYLLIAPIIALIAPFISFESGNSSLWISEELPTFYAMNNLEIFGEHSTINWTVLIYGIGCASIVLLTSIQLFLLLKKPEANFLKKHHSADVFVLKNNIPSYSFFNKIYLNPHEQNETMILIHEAAHCKEYHSVDLLISAVYKGIFWYNPIIHLWSHSIKENHEYIADQYVMKEQIDASKYGKIMLQSTLSHRHPVLASGFHSPSLLRKRIKNLNNKNKYNMKHLLIIPAIAGITFLSSSLTNSPVQDTTNSMIVDQHETVAEFPGGTEAMMEYIQNELTYPKNLEKEGAEGKVYIGFEVSEKGMVENAKILRGSKHEEMNNEALRVVEKMPLWKPATKDGKAVRSSMTLPFVFKM